MTLIGSPWFPVYADGVPDSPGPRYAALWVPGGVLDDSGVAYLPTEMTVTFQVTGVGRGPAEARAVGQAVRDALVTLRPAVDGWVAGPVTHFASQPPRRDDDDPTGTVWIVTDQYEVSAARA